MVIWSSGPMIYSSLACCWAGIAGAAGRFEPPTDEQPVIAKLLALIANNALNFNDLPMFIPFQPARNPQGYTRKTSCTAHSIAFAMAEKGEQTVSIITSGM
jgi:hypothetical protein